MADDCELSRQECLALLATEPYGRLVLVRGGIPTVHPVNYLLDGAGLVVRTREGSTLCAAAGAAAVAMQADCIDRERRSGWSVTVVGRARIADDPVEVGRLAELPLQPWARGERNVFVVVEIGIVSGQRIGGAEQAHGDPARSLTAQERRVFELIGAGLSNRQIAQEMELAEKTVKNHVSALLRKLHLQRRTQAAVLAERTRHGDPLARAG